MSERQHLQVLLISNHRRFKVHFRGHPWARELAARGHDVDLMCHADTERWRTQIEQGDGFRIIHNPDLLCGALRQGWDPVCALRRRNFLFRENKRYDIIHCLDTRPAVILPALAYARARGITIVSDWIDWWGRGGLIAERRPVWYQMLFGGVETYFEEHYRNQLDGLTAISHALLERAVGLGVPRDRCLYIPGGANLKAFASAPSKAEARRLLGLPPSDPVLCFSGLDVLTDLPLVAHTFLRILQTESSARLLLVGPGARDVGNLFPPRIAGSRIIATGPVPYNELAARLAAADVFLMPYTSRVSNIGRWPNKIGDYMCIGRPTVSNPVGEVTALFEEYGVGVLAEEDPASMAEATLRLLRDPERAQVIGRRAAQIAQQRFAWDKLIVRLEDWYYELLDRRSGIAPRPIALVEQPAGVVA